jgi:hypothetical protein
MLHTVSTTHPQPGWISNREVNERNETMTRHVVAKQE